MFRWTPFGIIGNMHGDYFIQQGKATREKELQKLRKHLKNVFWDRDRRLVILFPEGGFYYNRVESSQKFVFFFNLQTRIKKIFRYAKENGFLHLEHCTLPRMGAIQVILEEIGPRLSKSSSSSSLSTSRSASRLKILKDTVDAIREKKYVKGIILLFEII